MFGIVYLEEVYLLNADGKENKYFSALSWKVTYQISGLCSVILRSAAAICFLTGGSVVRLTHRVRIETFSKKILTESVLENQWGW